LILKLVATTGSPSVLITGDRPLTVGRVASCDLPIQDPTVSRHHAELELAGAGVRVRDVGSTNGTYLDGVRIIDALATPGSRVAFGKVDFEVLVVQPPVPEEEAFTGEGSLDATILRQVPVRGRTSPRSSPRIPGAPRCSGSAANPSRTARSASSTSCSTSPGSSRSRPRSTGCSTRSWASSSR